MLSFDNRFVDIIGTLRLTYDLYLFFCPLVRHLVFYASTLPNKKINGMSFEYFVSHLVAYMGHSSDSDLIPIAELEKAPASTGN